jgi:hypothetical protein
VLYRIFGRFFPCRVTFERGTQRVRNRLFFQPVFNSRVRGATIIASERLPKSSLLKSRAPLRGENIAMKCFSICTCLLLAAVPLLAQQKPVASPAATETIAIAGKTITINYNSPRVKGREGHIFTKDGLISHDPHYPVWRGGANPATTLHTNADLTIGDLKVPAGTYTLFVDISDPARWVFIVSKATGEWGLAYDSTKDLGRTPMTVSAPPSLVEDLKYTLTSDGGNKGTLNLTWENMSASVPFQVD